MKNKSKENPTCTGRSVKQTLRFLLCIALLLAVPKAGAQDVWDGKPDKSWYTDDSQEDELFQMIIGGDGRAGEWRV